MTSNGHIPLRNCPHQTGKLLNQGAQRGHQILSAHRFHRHGERALSRGVGDGADSPGGAELEELGSAFGRGGDHGDLGTLPGGELGQIVTNSSGSAGQQDPSARECAGNAQQPQRGEPRQR